MKFKTAFFLSTFFCLCKTYGQQKINGRVIGEDLEIGIGITIFDKDTIKIGETDYKGYFEIELQKQNEKIIFAGFDYEWLNIELPINCEYLEVILLYEGTYDFKSNRKVDRIRKKRFDKINEIHLQAFNKSLFKTKKTCFNREFEPYKPELDKIKLERKKFTKVNKSVFNELNIGDAVKIPFGIDPKDNEIRTYYSPCENCTENDYDFVIEGKIIGKSKRNLTLEIMITNMKDYYFLKHRGKILKVNSSFKYEIKYFEVIIE